MIVCCAIGSLLVFVLFLTSLAPTAGMLHPDLVQPNETHLEGVPVFIEHPKPIYYTMKDHPATVECVAEPVSHAVMECAEKAIPYKGPDETGRLKVIRLDSKNRFDPNGNRWRLQLQVRTKEVEEWFDSYVCRCEAWNKVVPLQRPKKVMSKSAVVVEAYLERRFQLEPQSTQLFAGQRLDLTCIPPDGRPEPEVYWMKNGLRVDHSQTHYWPSISGRTHLSIPNVTLNDSGNYTCVAELLGVEYRFANAVVQVQSPTKKPDRIPDRQESQPNSKQSTGSRDVFIYATMLLTLSFVLTAVFVIMISRRRKHAADRWPFFSCTRKKKPTQNGILIKNPAVYTVLFPDAKTTSGLPFVRTELDPLSPGESAPSIAPYETLDCTLPMNRMGTKRSGHTRIPSLSTQPYSTGLLYSLPPNSAVHEEMFYFSGLSQPVYAVANQLADSPDEPVLGNLPIVGFTTSRAENISPEQRITNLPVSPAVPMRVAPSVTQTSGSPEGPCSLDSTTNTTHISSSREDCGSDNLACVPLHRSPQYQASSGGPNESFIGRNACCSSDHVIMTHQGGQLSVKCADVQLCIPPDSMPQSVVREVYLNVCSGDQHRPKISDHQTLLTSVVEIGPADLNFEKPVSLRFPHCADLKQGNWRIYLMAAGRSPGEHVPPCNGVENPIHDSIASDRRTLPSTYRANSVFTDELCWKTVSVVGVGMGDSGVTCQLLESFVDLMTTLAQCYCLVGETHLYPTDSSVNTIGLTMQERGTNHSTLTQTPSNSPGILLPFSNSPHRAVKRFHLVAFAGSVATNVEYVIRIYVLPATRHFLEHAIRMEQDVGFRMMDIVEHWSVVDNGAGLVFLIKELATGWKCRLQTEKQEIPFRHVWSGSHTSLLHCSFSLEHVTPIHTAVCCAITVQQGDDLGRTSTLRIRGDVHT